MNATLRPLAIAALLARLIALATSQSLRRLALLLGTTTFLFNAWAQNQATLASIGRWPEYPLLATPMAMKVSPPYGCLAGLALTQPLTQP